jgi:uncharacterized protein (TIGR02001 family)
MIKSRIAVAGALLAAAGAVNAAGFSVTPTITSDYDFRGITQTDEDPAFQLGVNYGFENGVYTGIWGSNVDFGAGDPNTEIDLILGYAGGDAAESFGYDFGAVYYVYPGAKDLNTAELYAGISKGYFSGKLWYSPDIASTSDDGFYVEGNGTFPLPQNFSILAHAGYTFGDASWSGPRKALDYSVGVGYTVSNFSLSAKWVDTDVDGADTDRVIFSVSTTLPWASE